MLRPLLKFGQPAASVAQLQPRPVQPRQVQLLQALPTPEAIVEEVNGGKSRATDPKTELTKVLQRLLGKTLTKGDVVYETGAVGDDTFQSTVKLVCMGGEEYVGEVGESEKAAEHAAAQQALWNNAEAIAALPPVPPKPSRGKTGRKTAAAAPEQTPHRGFDPNPKTDLVKRLQVHCKRTLTKADAVYETSDLSGQFISSVRLACLDPPQDYQGQLAETDKAAEHSAAEAALMNEATWSPPAESPPQPVDGSLYGPNAKTELTIVLQKILQRALTKNDVVYRVSEEGEAQLGVVKLMCLNGIEYGGVPSANAKLAEQTAAQRALAALAAQAAAAPASKRSQQRGQEGPLAFTEQTALPPPPKRQRQRGPIPVQTTQFLTPGPRQTSQPLGYLPSGQPFGFEPMRRT